MTQCTTPSITAWRMSSPPLNLTARSPGGSPRMVRRLYSHFFYELTYIFRQSSLKKKWPHRWSLQATHLDPYLPFCQGVTSSGHSHDTREKESQSTVPSHEMRFTLCSPRGWEQSLVVKVKFPFCGYLPCELLPLSTAWHSLAQLSVVIWLWYKRTSTINVKVDIF